MISPQLRQVTGSDCIAVNYFSYPGAPLYRCWHKCALIWPAACLSTICGDRVPRMGSSRDDFVTITEITNYV